MASVARGGMLFERYRPQTLDDVCGQPRAVAVLRRELETGIGGKAFFFACAPGTGKSSCARILASTFADPWNVIHYKTGEMVRAEQIAEMEQAAWTPRLGAKPGTVFLIDECHLLRSSAVGYLLGALDPVPSHLAFMLTTTKEGRETLFGEEADAKPLLDRCIKVPVTNQALSEPFAERARQIAQAEGLDGQPIEAYIRLARKCKNSLRDMLSEIQAGAMLVD